MASELVEFENGVYGMALNLEEDSPALAAKTVQGLKQKICHLFIGPVGDGTLGHISDGSQAQWGGAEEHLGADHPLALLLNSHVSYLPAEFFL